MPRTARRIVLTVFLIQVLWSGVATVIMAVLWRSSSGEPDVSYACDYGATCYSGPTTYLVLMIVFGVLCLGFGAVVAVLMARWRAAAARRAHFSVRMVEMPRDRPPI